ncbi:MAG: hypothetical protein GEU77_16160 [Deltaproteobacteria bacterium]|nr:hypothetical protein [Deltaproteobacteria bacterium]
MINYVDKETIRRLAIWTLVYLIPAYQAMLPIEDPDIWWHLRTGQWVLSHGYVPTEDPFSLSGAGKPWLAYSWLFEVLVYGLYDYFGLAGLVAFTVAMSLAIAATIHLLIRRARLPFLAEVALLAMIFASLKPMLSPRPWLFSILFTVIELVVISHVRRSRKLTLGFFLPPMFALWANLHIQFVYGLAVLALLAVEAVFNRVARQWVPCITNNSLPLARVLCLLGLCVLATLVNPYHYRIYLPIVEYVTQTGAFQSIAELHPMFFRSLADWIVLASTVTAAFVLGWQRRWSIFYMALFGLAAYLAFRARRDGWFLMVVVAAIVSEFVRLNQAGDPFKFDKGRGLAIAFALFVSLYVLSYYRDVSEASLAKAVEAQFPVRAVEFVKSNRLEGQLYNSLDWGGYLIWSLPDLPVSMDGRTNLHGDARIARSLATWGGGIGWEKDPELLRARLVIAQIDKPLTHLLRRHPGYDLVYEDRTAAVFVVSQSTLR